MVLTNALGQLSSVPLHLTNVARDECLSIFAALPFPCIVVNTNGREEGRPGNEATADNDNFYTVCWCSGNKVHRRHVHRGTMVWLRQTRWTEQNKENLPTVTRKSLTSRERIITQPSMRPTRHRSLAVDTASLWPLKATLATTRTQNNGR